MVDALGVGEPELVELERPRVARDVLHDHAEQVVVALLFVGILLLIASISAGVSDGLPTIAFGWKFGLEIVRAAVVFAIFGVVAIILARGWIGQWPRRISTSGIDFEDEISDVKAGLEHASRKLALAEAQLRAAENQPAGSE
jgi:hypothetical protein